VDGRIKQRLEPSSVVNRVGDQIMNLGYGGDPTVIIEERVALAAEVSPRARQNRRIFSPAGARGNGAHDAQA
jgi:hypothetical protein